MVTGHSKKGRVYLEKKGGAKKEAIKLLASPDQSRRKGTHTGTEHEAWGPSCSGFSLLLWRGTKGDLPREMVSLRRERAELQK